jgi:hypothetical protein
MSQKRFFRLESELVTLDVLREKMAARANVKTVVLTHQGNRVTKYVTTG